MRKMLNYIYKKMSDKIHPAKIYVIIFAILLLPLLIYSYIYINFLFIVAFIILSAYYWKVTGGVLAAIYCDILLTLNMHLYPYDDIYVRPYYFSLIFNIMIGYGMGRLIEKVYQQNKKLKEEMINRQSIEDEILAKEERFRAIIATVPDLITIINKQGIFLDVWTGENKNLYKPRTEMIGECFDQILPDKVASKMRKNIENALRYNQIQEFEYSLEVIGGYRHFDARLTAINQEEAVMTVRDITDRKNAEKEIKKQRAYFKQLFDNFPEAIALLDNKERVIQINKGFERVFGYKEKDITGMFLNDLIVPEDKKEKAQGYTNKALNGGIVRAEAVRQRIDGSPIDVSILGYPIKFDDNQIGIYVIYQDITERKQLEENIKDTMAKIEKLHNIAIEMETCQSREDIYQLTVKTAENILNFDFCSLDILEGDFFKVKALSSGIKPDDTREMKKNEGLAGKAYMSGNSILSNDLTKNNEARPTKSTFKSGITIPIAKYGIFQIVSSEKNYFNQEDLRLTELLISHTTAALDRIETAEKIKEYATYDELTGVYNRRFGLEILKKKISLSARNLKRLSVCFADINNLKKANDLYGHQVGDQLITTVTSIIKDEIREMDSICRMGGDEFLVIFPDCTGSEAEQIWQRIKSRFDKINKKEDKLYKISVSHGIAEYIPEEDTDSNQQITEEKIDNLISRADQKMYKEKEITKGTEIRYT